MRRAGSACAISIVVLSIVGALGDVAVAASGPPLTKDQYIAQYNALCDTAGTNANEGINALPRNHDNGQVAHVIVPIFQLRLNQTRKLVPPTADTKRVKKLLAAQQGAINQVKDDSESIAGGRMGQTLGENVRQDIGKQADKLARAYGLESGICLDQSPNGPQPTAPCPGVGPCAGQGGGTPPPAGSVPPPPVPPSGGGPPGTTPAAQWVTAVCAADTTLHSTLQGELDAIMSKSDAASQKQGFVDFFSGLPAQVKTFERAIKKAGSPDVANGKAIAKTYLTTLKAIVKKAPSLKSMVEALPTSSTDAFQNGAKSIGQAIDAIKRKGDTKVSSLDASGTVAPNLGMCGGIFPL